VHLAAVGRFYSNPKLGLAPERDHRYMANVVSSAIVNKPPPQAVANLLARRNKIHHLDASTDETLLRMFDRGPGPQAKTNKSNQVTMPSRNWAVLVENAPAAEDAAAAAAAAEDSTPGAAAADGHAALHAGEADAGTTSRAADDARRGTAGDGSLDVVLRVERDQRDPDGRTTAYGMSVPRLRAARKTDGRGR
jgi:hypothetical protein